MNQIIEFIQSISALPLELIDYLTNHLRYREIGKKEYLLKAGHTSRSVCFIEKGLLRAFYMKEDKDITSWFMKEGDFSMSIESFYEQKPSYENIQALEDCIVYTLEFNELEYLYQRFPEFNLVGRLLTIKYHVLWVKQLYSIRMQAADERYKWLLVNDPDLLARVPAKFIASYLDITEVTLSKIKGNLAKKRK